VQLGEITEAYHTRLHPMRLKDKQTMTGMEQDMEKGVHGQEGHMLRLTHQTLDCHGLHFPTC